MPRFDFETVDVFTDQRFGGNPLAVFTDASGMDGATMQALAAELNLSETAFVLRPTDPANDARVRIFNRSAEMPFAGHPSIGTACVLARRRNHGGASLKLELAAGLVEAELERSATGQVTGARIAAPQPLTTAAILEPVAIAACLGLPTASVLGNPHPPTEISVGMNFVAAAVTPDAMVQAAPDIARFRETRARMAGSGDRLSLLIYARTGDQIHARMFAPLSGTYEDPATGSANAALAAFLLSIDGSQEARFTSRQGAEMGRPSLLHLAARQTPAGIVATVAGDCISMFSGCWEDHTAG